MCAGSCTYCSKPDLFARLTAREACGIPNCPQVHGKSLTISGIWLVAGKMWKLSLKNNSGLVKQETGKDLKLDNSGLVKQETGKDLKLEVLSRIKIVVFKVYRSYNFYTVNND